MWEIIQKTLIRAYKTTNKLFYEFKNNNKNFKRKNIGTFTIHQNNILDYYI
jgi:hypothetical protein